MKPQTRLTIGYLLKTISYLYLVVYIVYRLFFFLGCLFNLAVGFLSFLAFVGLFDDNLRGNSIILILLLMACIMLPDFMGRLLRKGNKMIAIAYYEMLEEDPNNEELQTKAYNAEQTYYNTNYDFATPQ